MAEFNEYAPIEPTEPNHPDYYNRFIVPLGDTGRRIVVASRLPEVLAKGTHIGLEVDHDGLPIPQPMTPKIQVVDLGGHNIYQNDQTSPDGPSEKHFRQGGASAITGLYNADTDTFGPLTGINNTPVEDVMWASVPEGEQPGLDNVLKLIRGVIKRDWSDINSRHNPDTLATYTSHPVVHAMQMLKLLTFDHEPGQHFEDSQLYKDLKAQLSDPVIWDRVSSKYGRYRDKLPEDYMRDLKEDYEYMIDGVRKPLYVNLHNNISHVVSSVLLPDAEHTLAEHADEIAELNKYNARDTEHLEELKEAESKRSAINSTPPSERLPDVPVVEAPSTRKPSFNWIRSIGRRGK